MNLTLKELNKCFYKAWEEEAGFIAVLVRIKEQNAYETIINESSSFVSKKKYYNDVYSDDLTHKYSAGIRIVDFAFGNSFDDIQKAWECSEQNQ